ncbi:MAG: hypothetical protein A2Y21_02445 [Clostridiales bacterium GWC2_40_7]|nr:MAG: hypothetical protein A2Y21_02445 [Clostridiales bacterium GWC2_40_7]
MNILFEFIQNNIRGFIVLALTGGFAAALAQCGIALFHDASRQFAADVRFNSLDRKIWFKSAFPVSIGVLLGIGLPFSLISGYILVHLIFVGTDVIGACIDGKGLHKALIAGIIGAVYAMVLRLVLWIFFLGTECMYIRLTDYTGIISFAVIYSFVAVPAITVFKRSGTAKGILCSIVTVIAGVTIGLLREPFIFNAAAAITAGLLCAVLLVASKKASDGLVSIAAEFAANPKILIKSAPLVFIQGVLYTATINSGMMAEGPQSLLSAAADDRLAAGAIALSRAVSFIPIKSFTALTSGVFPVDGIGFAAAAAFMFPSEGVWILFTAVVGGLLMLTELALVMPISKMCEKRPGLKEFSEDMRTISWSFLEFALLAGCIYGSLKMGSMLGVALISGTYMFNSFTGRKLPQVSVALIAFIVVYILSNITRAVLGVVI